MLVIVRPGALSRRREVPDDIMKPDYADDPEGIPHSEVADREQVPIYSDPEELEKIRTASRVWCFFCFLIVG